MHRDVLLLTAHLLNKGFVEVPRGAEPHSSPSCLSTAGSETRAVPVRASFNIDLFTEVTFGRSLAASGVFFFCFCFCLFFPASGSECKIPPRGRASSGRITASRRIRASNGVREEGDGGGGGGGLCLSSVARCSVLSGVRVQEPLRLPETHGAAQRTPGTGHRSASPRVNEPRRRCVPFGEAPVNYRVENCRPSAVNMRLFQIVLFFFEIILLVDCARGPPRVSEKILHRQMVRIGRTMKLPCPVESDPPPLIMWTKDGRNIHSGWTRFRVLRQGLKIKDVEADDAGTFICKATNGFGSVNINYTLIVINDSSSGREGAGVLDGGDAIYTTGDLSGKLVRPRFTQPAKMRKRVIARPVGSSVRLKCAASGYPRPDITWLKDSRPLSSQEVGEGRKKKWTLSLKNLTPEHSGKYTCRVSNRAGEINATYKVEVIQRTNSKPILTGTHPLNTTVDYGGTTSFQCKVRSDVKPVIQWLKRVEPGDENKYNSTIEVGDHRFVVLPTGEVWSRPDGSYLNKLLITRAKEEDAGMYICLGANTMGYSFRSAFLTVLPDPKPPTLPLPVPPGHHLPWPVIIGIPAGVVFIFGTILLWLCQSKKHCSAGSAVTVQSGSAPSSHRQPGRDRPCPAPADKDCAGSVNYDEYLAQQQQLLLAQGGSSLAPKAYPKIYTDIHTHTHSHVDGKVHQHQHIHYQC